TLQRKHTKTDIKYQEIGPGCPSAGSSFGYALSMAASIIFHGYLWAFVDRSPCSGLCYVPGVKFRSGRLSGQSLGA
ncbi:hypothetical protein LSUB1_G004942, partial [Lachnellula subtilissima]